MAASNSPTSNRITPDEWARSLSAPPSVSSDGATWPAARLRSQLLRGLSGGPSAYHICLSELAAQLRSFVRGRLAHLPCSLTLSADHAWLFAANAGSRSVSVFRVNGAQLELTDRVATEGSEPNSVAQFGSLVYVLNTAGSSGVVGFNFNSGKLVRIPNSLRFLSGNAVAYGSVAFSPDGQFLIVTEKATNNLDVFKVLSDGSLSQAALTTSVGPGAFSARFTRNDVALVSETGSSAPNSSAISSNIVQSNLQRFRTLEGPQVSDKPAQIKVFHVEDDPSVARAVARLLRLRGYEVISASSGHEAIQLVEDGLIPDLILTDYCLAPHMTGDQVVIEIARRLGFKPPTILLASAPGIAASVADRVFSKPADMDAVVREIERLIGTRS